MDTFTGFINNAIEAGVLGRIAIVFIVLLVILISKLIEWSKTLYRKLKPKKKEITKSHSHTYYYYDENGKAVYVTVTYPDTKHLIS